MTVAVARAYYVARDAADKAKAVENRLAATRRMTNLAQTPTGDSKSSMVSFADTREASERSALFGSPDEIAAKLAFFRDAGVSQRPPQQRRRLPRPPAPLRPRGDAGVRGAGEDAGGGVRFWAAGPAGLRSAAGGDAAPPPHAPPRAFAAGQSPAALL